MLDLTLSPEELHSALKGFTREEILTISSLAQTTLKWAARPARSPLNNVSKIGGRPNLPPDFSWPTWEHPTEGTQNMMPIAQLKLGPEFAQFGMPTAGILSFWAAWSYYEDCFERFTEEGLEFDELGDTRVFWFKEETSLRDFPEDVRGIPEAELMPFLATTVPDDDFLDAAGLPGDHLARRTIDFRYNEHLRIQEALPEDWPYEPGRGDHQTGGHPNPEQGAPQREFVQGKERDEAKVENWRLLLQLDSDYLCNLQWEDVGRLYWMIPERALKERDWSKAALVVQW